MDIDKRCRRVNCGFDYWVFRFSFCAEFMAVVCDVGLVLFVARPRWPCVLTGCPLFSETSPKAGKPVLQSKTVIGLPYRFVLLIRFRYPCLFFYLA